MLNAPFDWLAIRGGDIKRVQVKTVRRRERNGTDYVVVDCTDGSGRRYEAGDVDLFAAYDKRERRAYYFTYGALAGRREMWIDPAKIYQL